MNQPIKVAISSFGLSGQAFHGPSLKVNSGFEVVQVLERSKDLSQSLFPDAEIVRNFEEIVNNSAVELVIVNTPDYLHFEMAKQVINAGKHLVVEKPVAQKSAEAAELVQLAKEKGVVFSVYQNRRLDGDFLTVKKILEQGNLGRLVEFESHFDRYRTYITPDTWKEEGDEYIGVLHNLGSHMVDQAYVLFGKPSSVNANLKIVRTGGNVADYYDIRLGYENFAAILKCSYLVMYPGPRYSLYGEYGTFHKWGIDPQEDVLRTGTLPQGPDWGKEAESEWGKIIYERDGVKFLGKVETIQGNYPFYYKNLYEAIRKGKELLVKPEETVEVLEILEACLESNRKKKMINL
ncbi:oxidoreductase [Maribellus comscasis]|uniref:Oxidoreductase n=1 Tax=Maribellus comscasis TaxID=2681766 RepID=A0A6I6K854_9BACT|nr:Gfo/Idh/MocA family oxidoreductase [Maribellus comscasis]QGY46224.1 oxidoreductase [Maribellus comscasis]